MYEAIMRLSVKMTKRKICKIFGMFAKNRINYPITINVVMNGEVLYKIKLFVLNGTVYLVSIGRQESTLKLYT